MKKIVIISDTHGRIKEISDIIADMKNVDAIVHAGDFAKDAEKLEWEFPEIPIYYVSGNCDFFSDTDPEKLCQIYSKKFFIAHGHTQNVKSETRSDYPTITEAGKNKGADVIIFGHTHEPYIGYSGKTIIINPGSAGYTSTYAVCIIDKDKISADIFKM